MSAALHIPLAPHSVEFDSALHSYTVRGVRKPSVTEVLGTVGVKVKRDDKPAQFHTMFDYSFLDKAAADEAKARGRWVADLVALFLKGGPISNSLRATLTNLRPDWMPYFECFERWWATMRGEIEPLMIEQPLYSPTYDFVGSPDLVAIFRKQHAILDWKTGIASLDTQYQTGGYEILVREQPGYRDVSYFRRFAVELNNEGREARMIEYKNHTNDRGMFLSTLRVYNALIQGVR
jgi:hypothetical protein